MSTFSLIYKVCLVNAATEHSNCLLTLVFLTTFEIVLLSSYDLMSETPPTPVHMQPSELL